MQYTSTPHSAIRFDGQSAEPQAVNLLFRGQRGELHVLNPEDGPLASPVSVWPLARLRLVSGSVARGARGPVRLARIPDNGERLVISDPNALEGLAPPLRALIKERKKTALVRWFIIALFVWSACLTLYAASSSIFSGLAWIIPPSWEQALGASAKDKLLAELTNRRNVKGIHADATQSAELDRLVRRLAGAAAGQAPRHPFTITVLNADFVNAFALPGGYVILSTGLIKACATPDQLAGVLAHEMAHVTEQHGLAGIFRAYAWNVVAHLFGGGSISRNVALSLITASYSRDDEAAADLLGAERLAVAGINPLGMADFFDMLQKKDGNASEASGASPAPFAEAFNYLASHPELGQRRNSILHWMRANGYDGSAFTPAMDGQDWQRLRALCGAAARPGRAPAP